MDLEFYMSRLSSLKYFRIIFWFFGLIIIPFLGMAYGLAFAPLCVLTSTLIHINPDTTGNIALALSVASAIVTYYLFWRCVRKSLHK